MVIGLILFGICSAVAVWKGMPSKQGKLCRVEWSQRYRAACVKTGR